MFPILSCQKKKGAKEHSKAIGSKILVATPKKNCEIISVLNLIKKLKYWNAIDMYTSLSSIFLTKIEEKVGNLNY